MSIPVVIAKNGLGAPVRPVDKGAPAMTVADNGFGAPIVISELGAPFVVSGLSNIDDLFANGETGVWFDPSPDTCFTDEAGAIPASVGQSVAMMLDKSPNGNHATQPTVAARPILQQTAEGLYYLEFDGVDDDIGIPWSAFNPSGDQTIAIGAKHDTGTGANIYLMGGRSDRGYMFVTSGTTNRMRFIPATPQFAQPTASTTIGTEARVYIGDHDRSTGVARLFQDGAAFTDTGPAGVSVYTPGDGVLYLGSGNTGGGRWAGNIYSTVAVGRMLTDDERVRLSSYISSKSGVVL